MEPRSASDKRDGMVKRQLAKPDVLERMHFLGFEPAPSTPEQLAELIRSDTKRYAELVRRTGATAK
jgi:tripartite-type tricarboxylate transporter receptor subunit TctC